MNDSAIFVSHLASIYNEPGDVGGKKNIKLQLLESFIQDNFNVEHYEKLFSLITANFQPTAANPYPLPKNVKEIWETYNTQVNIEDDTNRTRKLISETFGQPAQIEYNIPDVELNPQATSKEMLVDEYKHNADWMIAKYGKEKCYAFWKKCGENWEKFLTGKFERDKTSYEKGLKYD